MLLRLSSGNYFTSEFPFLVFGVELRLHIVLFMLTFFLLLLPLVCFH